MKIIKPANQSAEALAFAEQRLVAAMYCMEHAAIVCDENLDPLPPPHAPWPTVAIPPVTEKGLAATVHYRPSLGVVYCGFGGPFGMNGARIRDFVNRVATALDAQGDAHLQGHRATMATPAVVVRQAGRVVSGSVRAEVAEPFRRPAVAYDLPARMYLWTPAARAADPSQVGATSPPPHFSARAAFTWVFLPVTDALGITHCASLDAVNALVAGIVFDTTAVCRHPDGAEIPRLTLQDFVHTSQGAVPKVLSFDRVRVAPKLPWAWMRRTNAKNHAGALVIHKNGSLEFVGHYLNLRRRINAIEVGARPDWPWVPEQVATATKNGYPACCNCCAPVGGPAIVFAGAKIPLNGLEHVGPEFYYATPGTPGDTIGFFGTPARSKRYLLCVRCWEHLDSADCLIDHLGALVWRTTVPLTQAQACARCPGYESLAPLLEGRAVPIAEVPGAYIVEAAGAKLILAGATLGSYPGLAIPALAPYKLPIVAELRLAEVN